nr:reverse transcriptase domain-containing protein [Tanacetum cinerariifolium]
MRSKLCSANRSTKVRSRRPPPEAADAMQKAEDLQLATVLLHLFIQQKEAFTPPFINPEEDERVEETLTDPEHAEYTIKVPPPLVQKAKPPTQRNYMVHQRDPPVILKKLSKKLGDPGKFLLSCYFSELKCKALAGLGASINLLPLMVWKKLGLPELISTRMTLELANRAICTLTGIARDVFVPVGKLTFLVNFVIVDYQSDPRFPLMIDELDPSRSSDFLPYPEYDSVLYEDFCKVDALPSTNNEDKVFNPGIIIYKNLSEVTIQGIPDKNVKKIFISNASVILEDFNPPLNELPFHKEVPGPETPLSFSSENEEKVFKPGILTSKGVHTSLLSELSHWGPKAFKVIKILKARWRFFLALMERTSVFWMFRVFISIPHKQLNSRIGSS